MLPPIQFRFYVLMALYLFFFFSLITYSLGVHHCSKFSVTISFDLTAVAANYLLNSLLQVTFQWNGITSKKKGQKWGKEKTVFQKRNDGKKVNSESSDMLVDEEETPTVNVPVDFDKLKPCTTLPQVCCLVLML